MWSINCALLRIIVPNRVIPSGFLSIFVINKNIDMALQTTGLEFFYLSVDFSENDKILLVEQELGYIAPDFITFLRHHIAHNDNQRVT